jgi:hypothetical protein
MPVAEVVEFDPIAHVREDRGGDGDDCLLRSRTTHAGRSPSVAGKVRQIRRKGKHVGPVPVRVTAASDIDARVALIQALIPVGLERSSDWVPIFRVPSTESWTQMAVDLTPHVGAVVQVRLVFEALEPTASDFWQVDNLQLEPTR